MDEKSEIVQDIYLEISSQIPLENYSEISSEIHVDVFKIHPKNPSQIPPGTPSEICPGILWKNILHGFLKKKTRFICEFSSGLDSWISKWYLTEISQKCLKKILHEFP